MSKMRFLTFAWIAFAAFPGHVMAWGCAGHQTVALIAQKELNPTALSSVNAILNAFSITIHRNCTKQPGTTPMSDAATWADDVRAMRSNTAEWHFIDVPFAKAGSDSTPFCNGNCVMQAITDQIAVLRDPTKDGTEAQTEALRFIIHFVGDVHQPLHTITNADRGGNCDPIAFNKSKPRASGSSYTPELHGIWDTQMVEGLESSSSVDDPDGLAQLLFGEITAAERAAWKTDDVNAWAMESSKLGATAAYMKLTNAAGSPISPASLAGSEVANKCVATKEKAIVAMGLTATTKYQDGSEAVIEEQLKKAGIRLANVLNEIWPADGVTEAHQTVHKASQK